MSRKASEPQKRMIRALQFQNGFTVSSKKPDNALDRLSMETASSWIALLQVGIDPRKGNSPRKRLGVTSGNTYQRSERVRKAVREAQLHDQIGR